MREEGKERGQNSAVFLKVVSSWCCAVASLIRERPVVSGGATLVRHTSLVECGMGALIGALTVQCAYIFGSYIGGLKKLQKVLSED
jgi:hypothetical protein